MGEVRAFLRQSFTASIEEEEAKVDVMKDVFVDDFLNVFEIACSIQGKKEGA